MNDYYDEYFEMCVADEIIAEYQEKMKEVLLASIKEEVEGLREENEVLRKTVGELLKKESQFEAGRAKIARDSIKEYQRTMLAGLTVGDNVWTIHTDTTAETCPHCKGNYEKVEVEVFGKKTYARCPHCSYGKITTSKIHSPIKREIVQIKTSFWNNGNTFKRELYLKEIRGEANEVSDSNYNYENSIHRYFFMTEEECQKECDKERSE